MAINSQTKLTFSGHDSFHCRHLWLKKGYDYIKKGKKFSDNDSVVELGVGKNMVASIKHWMKAFDLVDENDELSELSHKIFNDENGWDKYLEDDATLWILHHNIVKKGYATTYNWIFNELRKEKIEFTQKNFFDFVNRKLQSKNIRPISPNTINSDFSVFIKMYLRTDKQNNDKEDTFSGILTELDLIKELTKDKSAYFLIENKEREDIPEEVLLYAILSDERFDRSVNVRSLEIEDNSIASIFAITRTGLISKIESIANNKQFSFVRYSDHAGIKELQFEEKKNPLDVLKNYYEG